MESNISYRNLFPKNTKDIRCVMVYFGFDFSLVGTMYIFELLTEVVNNTSILRCESIPTMTLLADKHNVKIKSFNRVIRWSIVKAFKTGLLKYVPFFEDRKTIPPTKQVLAWLFNYYIMQFE